MYRIGILGSDNSHALSFAKLCNLPDKDNRYTYDDIRITAIYGHDDDPLHTEEVAEKGNIPAIVKNPDELYGKVDAVMAVHRHGGLHVPQTLAFIEKGYPVWIDKPIAVTIEDIDLLRQAVSKNNALITGGSSIKYNYEILTLKNKVEKKLLGDISGGSMNFPCDLSSQYGGIFFYGSHLCEMCLTVFGYDIKSVIASSVNSQNTMVIAKYADKQIALHFNSQAREYILTVHGSNASASCEMDLSLIYKLEFDQFANMLRTKTMPLNFESLVKPVYMLSAIQKSLDTGREASIGG